MLEVFKTVFLASFLKVYPRPCRLDTLALYHVGVLSLLLGTCSLLRVVPYFFPTVLRHASLVKWERVSSMMLHSKAHFAMNRLQRGQGRPFITRWSSPRIG